ncbi:hypothetical protein [Endozoicomonas sp. ALB115]|uniref:hypothetical protein n=1 Tax=Endozoicomonas sp. ALB115 TaxID=3403074 RepID=UPI003BB6B5C8
MNWQDYTSTPLWQQSDDAEKEHLRYRYWKDYLAPNIPSEHQQDARRLFDEHTARRGNPESNYLKDALWEAPWHQLYGAGASMASGADRFFGGDGNNTVSQWLREKSEEQLDSMTPTDVEAMQGWDIEMGTNGLPHLKEGSTWRGFGLNLGGAVGSTLPTMVGGGLAARGFAALGGKALQASGAAATVKGLDDARRVQVWADRIHKGSHAAGYGLVGGWQVGADSADRAKEVILQASQEELLADPKFQELYRQTYDASGGGDTRVPFQQARELLAEESAKSGYLPGFAVGLLSMGVAGPKMEGIALKARGSRKGNALHGAMTEGLQEFGEGFGGEMAANYGVQRAGLERDLTENALAQGIKGTALGAPVGGGLGLLGRTRNPEAASILQNKLNDLMSQHQTLQDQMQEPHADQTMLTEQLRQNSLAIASLESQLRELGEQVQQPEAEATLDPTQTPEGWADHHEGYTDPLTGQYHPPDPKMDIPTGWDDHNPKRPPGGSGVGVSDIPNSGPKDFNGYDQPAWQRNRAGNPAEAVRFGQRYVDTAEPTSNLEQPSQWNGRSVGLEGQSPINTPMDTRNVGMPKQEVPQPAPQDNRWKNRTVTREKSQPVEPQQQSLPYYPPADFTGNRYGTVDSDPQAAQQDSQQRRAEQLDRSASRHPGSPEYTGNPDQDLASYTERMNSLNRLFRSFNWQRGDESKKRRVRKLIENQRRLEMKARKSGRGITPTSMKEALANLKAMVESGEGIRFEREVKAIEDRQQQEGLRLTAQQKSGTPSGIKPVMGKGNEKVSTAERELDTQYALYEADDLIASHNDTGKVNPDYPVELQPRDRTRQASEDQIRGIASKLNPKLLGANPLASSGAPIIGSDRVVESGNGRVSAIRKAYRNHPERAKAYREHLKQNAKSYGLKPESVDNFKQPVLVRQRQGEMDTDQRIAFTKEANARDTASMSPAEKAKLDASRITQEDLSHFDTDDTGDLLHRSNDVFLARFADRLGSEAGELKTRQGDWNKQMRDRVESALFMKAYDDERLNSLFAEDDKPDLKNLIKSLAMAAPHFSRAKGIDPELGGYGVIESLVEASRILQDSRNRNQSVDEILDQHSLLDSFSPETELFARWLDANLHKSKQVGQALSELANQIEQYLQKQSQADGDMFGTAEATLNDLIDQTNNQLEKNYGDKSTTIKDPKWQQKAEPVQTAEESNRSSEPEERSGRTVGDASEAERTTQRDEVDDLLDAVDDGTLDSDEWTDDDFAGIEEEGGNYDTRDGGSATKRRERDWYNSRNAPHYSVPGFKSLGGAERAAIKRYLDGRTDKPEIIQRLKKLADTPWARKTVQSMLIRQTIDDLIAGNNVDYRSLLSEKDNASVLDYLKNDGEAGLWRYLHNEDLLGHAGKPQNSINGSFIDCQPSRDCASFCYATKG